MRDLAHRSAKQIAACCPVHLWIPGIPAEMSMDLFLRRFWISLADPPDIEYIKEPIYRLLQGDYAGDCDDAATFAAAVLLTYVQRVPMCFYAIRMPDQDNFSHVWLNAGGIDIDPIVPESDMPVRGWVERIRLDV